MDNRQADTVAVVSSRSYDGSASHDDIEEAHQVIEENVRCH